MRSVPRSMLFSPATKTSHFSAAATVGADAVILDLEDSVAPAAKDDARRAALNYFATGRFSHTSVALRINSPATLAGWRDLSALLDSTADPDFIVIPKAESAAVAAMGWIGYVIGPPLIGNLADVVGLTAALAVLPILLLTIATVIRLTRAFAPPVHLSRRSIAQHA